MESLLVDAANALKLYDSLGENILAVISTITFYHIFKVTPFHGVICPLHVRPNPNDGFDENCMEVFVPKLSSIMETCHNTQTQDGCFVKDIAGKQIGNIPHHLARKLSAL